jgi:hypothetical protein
MTQKNGSQLQSGLFNKIRHWRWTDRCTPEWFQKNGSWHVKQLKKLETKTFNIFDLGLKVENGWGTRQTEVRDIVSQLNRLSSEIKKEKEGRFQI